MKYSKRFCAFLLAVTFLPMLSANVSAESRDAADGKELVSVDNGYTLDLGRAYAVDDVVIGGVDTSSARVIMSNDPNFAQNTVRGTTNAALDKPITSKLYGKGGYNSTTSNAYVAAKAVDGNSSTCFLSTPNKTTVEWLTVDLQNPTIIENVSLNFSANRSYSVVATNTKFADSEEITDGVELTETSGGSKRFTMPESFKTTPFRYVRLRFNGDAPSDNYLDTNMYVYEIAVNGYYAEQVAVPDSMTTELVKDGSVFKLGNSARSRLYRYLKVSGVSQKPTVRVNTPEMTAELTNAAENSVVSIPEGAAIYGGFVPERVIDGSVSTFTAFNHHTPYVQLDLLEKKAISHVEVYCRQDMDSDRENVMIALSNSPDFDKYVILGEQSDGEKIGQRAAFVAQNENILDCYRYVRVYEGDSVLVLSEVKVYAKDSLGKIYNAADNASASAVDNDGIAYRATDSDVKSFWSGTSVTVKLDRCYTTHTISLTGCGNIKLTYGCNNGTKKTYATALSDGETAYIPFDGNVSFVKAESTDGNAVKVYDLGVYVKNENKYINKIEPVSKEKLGAYEFYDLGRQVIIDHIEPCNSEVIVSSDYELINSETISGCKRANVTARYVAVMAGTIFSVIGYDAASLVNSEDGKRVVFNPEILDGADNATAFAAFYDENGLQSVVTAPAKNGEIEVDDGDCAAFMLWDSSLGMFPIIPKTETKYVNEIPQAEFFVDPSADVSGNGSQASPFKTIAEAQTAVRKINRDMSGNIIVNLSGGKYYLDSTLDFNNSDSGTNGYKVIYQNADGETPIVTGGKPITGFKEYKNGIWYADASGFEEIYELAVNGEAATLAHTENPITAESFYGGSSDYTYDGISFSKEKLPMLSNAEDAFVHTTRSWMDVILKVESATEKNGCINLDMAQPRFNDATKTGALSGHMVTPQSYFYVENALELLDTPGEFYFDKSEKKIYYMPKDGENMATAEVEGAVCETLVKVSGKNKSNHVSDLSFRGINFQNATFKKLYNYGLITGQAQLATFDVSMFIDGAIQIDYATDIEISDCDITGVTKSAISMGEGVVNSTVADNRIYNVGDSAVVVGRHLHNEISGSEELCVGNTIENNIIYKTGQKHKGAPAVTCYYVADTDIVHNKITECNYTGISLGWGWSHNPESTTCRKNRVAQNYIENTNLTASDGGAIYTLGQQPGTVIEGNYIVQNKVPQQTTGISGIYPDEGSAYITVRNNVIDIQDIKEYGGSARDLNLWISTIHDIYAHDNYSTYTNVRNDGTDCTVDMPIVYKRGAMPNEVKRIIGESAQNLK